MISDYFGRLVCLCFAAFVLVHSAVGALVLLAAPAAIRRAGLLRARAAARFLLFLRLAPLFAASLVVLALCLPSYLWFEPRGEAETIGAVCVAAAVLGALQLLSAASRSAAAAVRTLAFDRDCRSHGKCIRVPAQVAPVLVVDTPSPLLALSGLWRPALFLSRGVFTSLAPEELDVALSHEDAHRRSRDNWKRLALLLAPDLFPFGRLFASLERHWARCCEWAADDEAAAGDPQRSLSLASALVRVARMGSPPQPQLATPLTECGCGLEARVDRLLRGGSLGVAAPAVSSWPRRRDLLVAGAFTTFVVLLPGALAAVHGLLEKLVR